MSDTVDTEAARPGWYTRLLAERNELTARLAKLRGFLFDPASNHLSNTQRALLQAQASAMETYLVILNLRVAYAGEAGHG